MEVEAAFQVGEKSMAQSFLHTWEMEPSREIVIRRVIRQKGANKVFINGSLATAAMLASMGPHLMSIVGQYDQQILTQPETHIDLLDEFADLKILRDEASELFNRLRLLTSERRKFLSRRERDSERLELLKFQFGEIENSSLQENEDLLLEAERSRLRNAEKISSAARNSYIELYGADKSLTGNLSSIVTNLEKIVSLDPELKPLAERLQSAALEVEDVSLGLREYAKKIVFDASRLDWIENRLAEIKNLSRKYGNGVKDILERQSQIAREIEKLESTSVDFGALEEHIEECADRLLQVSQKLSSERKRCATELAHRVERELESLNMVNLVFQVHLEKLSPQEKEVYRHQGNLLGPRGMDSASFLISPNPGEEPRPLSRIASGGELSRILLGLKGILAGRSELETLVFDEVDTGIGGEAAEKVGIKLQNLSKIHQILCITHLPQIACFADHHFLVTKNIVKERTLTEVNILDESERQREIVRMLGGNEAGEKALDYARDLISRAHGNI